MAHARTIAAIATAAGFGGVGIVRVSGEGCVRLAHAIVGLLPEPRRAHYCAFRNASGAVLDHGLAIYFPAPHSYTAEDVLEFQGHGSPQALHMLLQTCLDKGAQLAKPGEFTERAFLNGKLDLTQAESVIDLIEARSDAAARAALRSLDGAFSNNAQTLVEQLIGLRVYIEAALDFSEEEIDFLASDELMGRVERLLDLLHTTIGMAEQGRLLREGATVVIGGAPNVGKSSLLNRLVGRDAAIITDIAGTTRDVLREPIQIDGLPITLIDTAGLRDSDDPVEQEGIRRARQEIDRADRLYIVCDVDQAPPQPPTELQGRPYDLIINKIDLQQQPARVECANGQATIYLSAKTGEGIDGLKAHIKQSLGFNQVSENTFIARKRHTQALQCAKEHIDQGLANLADKNYLEIVAEDFQLAQHALQAITGAYTSDNLLSEIFADFCIGK